MRQEPARPLTAEGRTLTPMENVWNYLRQNKLCARVWNKYEDIINPCKAAWNWLIEIPDQITSIGKREWACVSV